MAEAVRTLDSKAKPSKPNESGPQVEVSKVPESKPSVADVLTAHADRLDVFQKLCPIEGPYQATELQLRTHPHLIGAVQEVEKPLEDFAGLRLSLSRQKEEWEMARNERIRQERYAKEPSSRPLTHWDRATFEKVLAVVQGRTLSAKAKTSIENQDATAYVLDNGYEVAVMSDWHDVEVGGRMRSVADPAVFYVRGPAA